MKIYRTEILNKSEQDLSIPEHIFGGRLYLIPKGKTVTVETTDSRNFLAPFDKITIVGEKAKERCKVQKRKGWVDPFKDSPRRCEMLNHGGFYWEESLFVQSGECYTLIRGIPIVCEVQPDTWVEKYKKITIAEPYNRQVPSRVEAGKIDVIEVQNFQYELRSEEELEKIRQRKEEEKNKIRV